MASNAATTLRPPRKPAKNTAVTALAVRILAALGSAAGRHKALSAAALLVVAAAATVSWNALIGQPRAHPYPMFGSRSMPVPRAVDIAAAPAPLPLARPKDLAPPDLPQAVPPTRASAAIDPIGDLIRAPETGSIRPADDQKAVASAQRHLTRLGYGHLKPDGVMGQGTKNAIERFERENKLPVTGMLAPRTSRALAAKAGA